MKEMLVKNEYLIDNVSSNNKIQGLVWFYGITTIVGHLMPNPFFYK